MIIKGRRIVASEENSYAMVSTTVSTGNWALMSTTAVSKSLFFFLFILQLPTPATIQLFKKNRISLSLEKFINHRNFWGTSLNVCCCQNKNLENCILWLQNQTSRHIQKDSSETHKDIKYSLINRLFSKKRSQFIGKTNFELYIRGWAKVTQPIWFTVYFTCACSSLFKLFHYHLQHLCPTT